MAGIGGGKREGNTPGGAGEGLAGKVQWDPQEEKGRARFQRGRQRTEH